LEKRLTLRLYSKLLSIGYGACGDKLWSQKSLLCETLLKVAVDVEEEQNRSDTARELHEALQGVKDISLLSDLEVVADAYHSSSMILISRKRYEGAEDLLLGLRPL